jgi:hypothetical protein
MEGSPSKLKKVLNQVCADLESGEDNDKGKNIFGVCFMAHGESDS